MPGRGTNAHLQPQMNQPRKTNLKKKKTAGHIYPDYFGALPILRTNIRRRGPRTPASRSEQSTKNEPEKKDSPIQRFEQLWCMIDPPHRLHRVLTGLASCGQDTNITEPPPRCTCCRTSANKRARREEIEEEAISRARYENPGRFTTLLSQPFKAFSSPRQRGRSAQTRTRH